jgi:hypothetical protein
MTRGRRRAKRVAVYIPIKLGPFRIRVRVW